MKNGFFIALLLVMSLVSNTSAQSTNSSASGLIGDDLIIEVTPVAPLREAPQQKASKPERAPVVSIEHTPDGLDIRLPVAPSELSEPMHAAHAVRLLMTLNGVPRVELPEPSSESRISVTAVAVDAGTRLTVEVPALRAYHVVTDSVGPMLRIAYGADSDADPDTFLRTDRPAAITVANGIVEQNWLRNAGQRVRAVLDYRIDTIGSTRTKAYLVAVASIAVIALLIAARSARAKSRPIERAEAPPQIVLPVRAAERDPERIAAQTRAAVWAAETLAGTGMDAAAIARRTGLARDATRLLVTRARSIVPGPAGSSPLRPAAEPGNRSRRHS